ncbi:MAG: hypothetical protein PHS47_03170 [Methanocellales archaeon]|nr:hypothetical protein [Methanocellales archaeon]MDD4898170.1 hypothetical protein [Methanocellales archaeon]MDD5446744.1 hypothetical protein [Methanocellales archaeon]
MEKEIDCESRWTKHRPQGNDSAGAIYGLGFIGAAFYFIGQATTFWMGVLGLLKAILWPAFLVYELLKYLGV